MTTSTTLRMKAGIALAGAGALALVPVTSSGDNAQLAASTTQSVNLAAASDPIQAFIDDVTTQVQITGADRVNNPAPVGLADAPAHIAAGLAASGIRTAEGIVLSPLQVVALASAIANGDQAKAADAIKNAIDAPLWAADPALLSLWDAAPAPIGGEGTYTGAVWNAREMWRNAGLDLEGLILGVLDTGRPGSGLAATAANPVQALIDDVMTQVQTDGATRVNNPVTVPLADAPAHILAGVAASGVRTAESVVGSPLQLVALASAIANGHPEQGAADAIVNTIDAPLWAADPALLSAWDAAPAPIGGEGSYTGAVWNVREAWRTTGNTVESTLLDAAGLPKPSKLNDTAGTSTVRTVTLNVPAPQAPAESNLTSKAPVQSGNLFKPNKKADTGAQSGQQAKGPFGGLRDSLSKTATKVANNVSGKNADK